jgi:excisionase family DNA binding protein
VKASEDNQDRLITPGETAKILAVDPKTVARYARQGKLSYSRTLGGHRRFYENEIRALATKRSGVRNPDPDEQDESDE